MEILRTILFYCESKGLRFLIVGGHAANFHGISRQTGDLDLLVPRAQKHTWLELLERLRYVKIQDDDRFARFHGDRLAAWPIDLMFVDEETFAKLYREAHTTQLGVASGVRVVSARHLLVLKLHALKHYQEHRFVKDYQDVVALLRSGRAEVSRDDLRELCQQYATRELFERLERDWTGQ
ncbi:MAG: nucleotidyl transferase AbiEii/AbiGii toxin family protein [Planctomycetota bacterium]